jgi:TolB-like protein/Tfp pilus assembly protein PilF
MGDDEEATVRTLSAYREVFFTLIQQHNGKVLDSPGDNLLAEFVSVVDAVQCAVAVQKEISARNTELAENRRMQFRIGINLGDVIQEEGRIYGDGVNIAARLEGLAEPGGICISKTAFDHIESKLPYGYEFLGDQTVKNITKPVGAYRVLMQPRVTLAGDLGKEKRSSVRRMQLSIGVAAVLVLAIAIGVWQFNKRPPIVEPSSEEKMAYPLPDIPSIAVLPFTNLSGDVKQDYLGEAISENIIASLAVLPNLFVISRNSTFIYKNKPVKIRQVSEELGVQFVLEGSVVKSEDKVRVTVQLIDALTGRHKWSEKYDRKVQDFLNMLDEITKTVCTELDVKLGIGEDSRFLHKGTDNFEAWVCAIRAFGHLDRLTREDHEKANELLKRAIQIDPEYSYAWALLAMKHFYDARYGWGASREASIKKFVECNNKTLLLDESNYLAYVFNGLYYMRKREDDRAIAELERAISLAPGSPLAQYHLSRAFRYACRPKEAILHGKKALRLMPSGTWYYSQNIGWPYYLLGQYAEAISWFNETLEQCRDGRCNLKFPYSYLAMAYAGNGQIEEARFHMQKVLEYDPKFNLTDRQKQIYYKEQSFTEKVISDLRKAGAPEQPPSQ